jgi:hypothetical protein
MVYKEEELGQKITEKVILNVEIASGLKRPCDICTNL